MPSDSAAGAPDEHRRSGSPQPSVLSEVSTVPSACREQVAEEISSSIINSVDKADERTVPVPPATQPPQRGTRPQAHRPPGANRVMVPPAYPAPPRDSPTADLQSYTPDTVEMALELAKDETSHMFDADGLPIAPDKAAEMQPKEPDAPPYDKRFSESAVSTEFGTTNPAYINTLSNSSSAKTLQSSSEMGTMSHGWSAGIQHGASRMNPLSNSSSAQTLQTWSEVAQDGPCSPEIVFWNDSQLVAANIAADLLERVDETSHLLGNLESHCGSKPSTTGSKRSIHESIRPATGEEVAATHAQHLLKGSFMTSGEGFPLDIRCPPLGEYSSSGHADEAAFSVVTAQSEMSAHPDDAESVAGEMAKDLMGHADSMLGVRGFFDSAQWGSNPSTGSDRPTTAEEVSALQAAKITEPCLSLIREEHVRPGHSESVDQEDETVLSVGGSDASLLARNEAVKMVQPALQESQVQTGHAALTSRAEFALHAAGNESVMSLAASTLDEMAAVQTAELLAGAGLLASAGPQQHWPSVSSSARSLPAAEWRPQMQDAWLQEQLKSSDRQLPSELAASKCAAGDSMSGVSVYSLDELSETHGYGNVADNLVREVMLDEVASTAAKVDSSGLGNTSVLSVTTASEAEKAFALGKVADNIMGTPALPVFSTIVSDTGNSGLESMNCTQESAAKVVAAGLLENARRLSEAGSDATRSIVGSSLEGSVADDIAETTLETCVREFASAAETAAGESSRHKGLAAREIPSAAPSTPSQACFAREMPASTPSKPSKPSRPRQGNPPRKIQSSGPSRFDQDGPWSPSGRALGQTQKISAGLLSALDDEVAAPEQLEELRRQASDTLVKGFRDGRLAAAMGLQDPRRSANENVNDVRNQKRDASRKDIEVVKAAARAKVEGAVESGELAKILSEMHNNKQVASEVQQQLETDSSVVTRSVHASSAKTSNIAMDVTTDAMQRCFTVMSDVASAADGDVERPSRAKHEDLIQGFLKADQKPAKSDAGRSWSSDGLNTRSIAGNSSNDSSSRAAESIIGQTIFGCILAGTEQDSGGPEQLPLQEQASPRPCSNEKSILSEDDSSNIHANLSRDFMTDCLYNVDDEPASVSVSGGQMVSKGQSNHLQLPTQVVEPLRDREDASENFTATNSLPSAVEGILGQVLLPTDDDILDAHIEAQREARALAEKELQAKQLEVDELRAQMKQESERVQQAEKELAEFRSTRRQQALDEASRQAQVAARDDLQAYRDRLAAQNKALASEVSSQADTAEQFRQLYLANEHELVAIRSELDKARSHDTEELRRLRKKLDDVRNRSVEELERARSKKASPEGASSRTNGPAPQRQPQEEELRRVKDQLVNAARSGELNRVAKQVADDASIRTSGPAPEATEAALTELQHNFQSAKRSGDLQRALDELTVDKRFENRGVEENRRELKDMLVNAGTAGEPENATGNPQQEDRVEENRRELKEMFTNAGRAGQLDNAVSDSQQAEKVEESRRELNEMFMNAGRSGELNSVVAYPQPGEKVEENRRELKQMYMNAHRTEKPQNVAVDPQQEARMGASRREQSEMFMSAGRAGELDDVVAYPGKEDKVEENSRELKDIFMNAQGAEELENSMGNPAKDSMEDNRRELKEIFMNAARTGELERVLRKEVEDQAKDDREHLKDKLIEAANSGQLENVLSKVAASSAHRAEPELTNDGTCLEGLRQKVKGDLSRAFASGELECRLHEIAHKHGAAKLEATRLKAKNRLIELSVSGQLEQYLQRPASEVHQAGGTAVADSIAISDAPSPSAQPAVAAAASDASQKVQASPIGETVLIEHIPAGSTVLAVNHASGFDVGDPILIKSSAGSEANRIADFGSILIKYPLKFDHPAGASVKKLELDDPRVQAMGDVQQAERSLDLGNAAEEQASRVNDVRRFLRDTLAEACNSGELQRALAQVAVDESVVKPERDAQAPLTRELVIEQFDRSSAKPEPEAPLAAPQSKAPAAAPQPEAPAAAPKPQAQREAPAAAPEPKAPAAAPEPEARPATGTLSTAEIARRLRAIYYSCDPQENELGVSWANKRDLMGVCRRSQDICDFLHVTVGAEEACLRTLGVGDQFTFDNLKAFYKERSNTAQSLVSLSDQATYVSNSSALTDCDEFNLGNEVATTQLIGAVSPKQEPKPKTLDLDSLRLSYGREALRLTPHVRVSRAPILTGLDKDHGLMQTYGVVPELPAGLELDSASGYLHGTPIESTELKSFEISAEIVTADGRPVTLKTTIAIGVGQLAAPSIFQSSRPPPLQEPPKTGMLAQVGDIGTCPSPRSQRSSIPLSPGSHGKFDSSRSLVSQAESCDSRSDVPALANEMYEYAIECTATSDLNGLKALFKAGVLHPAHLDSKRIVDTNGRTLMEVARSKGNSKVISLFFGSMIGSIGAKPQPVVESTIQQKEQSRRSIYLSQKLENQCASGSFFYPTVPEVLAYDSPCSHLPKLSAGLTIKEFSVWPPLPQGLEVDKITGELSGCPEEEVEDESYTVTATLEAEKGGRKDEKVTCVIVFAVEEIQPPQGLSYPSVQRIVDSIRADEMSGPAEPARMLPELKRATILRPRSSRGGSVEIRELPSTPRTVQSPRRIFRRPPSHIRVLPTLESGTATHYEVDPPLPFGMTLDSTTGEIRGAPALNERKSCSTSHTILAENAEGMALCGLVIEVTTGAWDLTMLNMRTTWAKNQNELEEKMRETTMQKGRRATQMRKVLEPIARPKDLGRVDWKAQLEQSVSIIEQFAHLVPVQILDATGSGSMIVKGMGASSLLKCLGIKEDPHTLNSLVQAVEFDNLEKKEEALLGTAEGKKTKEHVIYLKASGENADRRANSEKKVRQLTTDKAEGMYDQAYALMEFKPTHKLQRKTIAVSDDKNTWTKDHLDREFKALIPHWKDRMFTNTIGTKLQRFKAWRQVCSEVAMPDMLDMLVPGQDVS